MVHLSSSISEAEKKFIIDGCRQNCRHDGRNCWEIRPSLIETSGNANNGGASSAEEEMMTSSSSDSPPIVMSHGSAHWRLATGETNVVVSVRAELVTPSHAHPNQGVVTLHVDLAATTTTGRQDNQSRHRQRQDEIESTLSQVLLPHLVDPTKLCIVPHYFAWRIQIDVYVLADQGGSIMDACGTAIGAALATTKLPSVRKSVQSNEDSSGGNKPTLDIDSDLQSATLIPGLPIDAIPNVQTVTILKAASQSRSQNKALFVLDATKEEEDCSFAQVHVVLEPTSKSTTSSSPNIRAIHKASGGSLPFNLLLDVTAFVSKNRTQ